MEKFIRRVIVFFVLMILFYTVWYVLVQHGINKTQRFITSPISDSGPTATPMQKNKTTLDGVINGELAGNAGAYGIVVKNLKTNEQFYFNEHLKFEPASLYKLWVMATVFDQIQNSVLSGNTILSQDIGILNTEFNIPSESAELTEGIITVTIADALNQMITVSDNYSALLLSEKVTNTNIQQYLIDHGLMDSSLGEPPITTPSDIALFLEKLYTGNLANIGYTQKMINLLKNQTINSKLPKRLPKDTIIAHKTGELDSYSHDAGIVYSKNGDYIIVVLTDSDMPPIANAVIASISKAVYDYFQFKAQ